MSDTIEKPLIRDERQVELYAFWSKQQSETRQEAKSEVQSERQIIREQAKETEQPKLRLV